MFVVILFIKQLKLWIRDPRPSGYNDEPYKEWMNNGWLIPLHYDGAEKYGMPSGHSALLFFSLFYLWWMKRNPTYMILGSFIAIITLVQRYKYKKHSILQLAVGAVLGIALSYLGYWITTAWFSKQNLPTMYKENVAK